MGGRAHLPFWDRQTKHFGKAPDLKILHAPCLVFLSRMQISKTCLICLYHGRAPDIQTSVVAAPHFSKIHHEQYGLGEHLAYTSPSYISVHISNSSFHHQNDMLLKAPDIYMSGLPRCAEAPGERLRYRSPF